MKLSPFFLSTALAACAAQPVSSPAPAPQAEAPPVPDPAPLHPVWASAPYAIRGEGQPTQGNHWRAVVTEDRILLASPSSAGWHVVPRPVPALEDGRHVFRTERLTLSVSQGGCEEEGRPDRVTLDWDGGTWQGCGGPRPTPGRITDAVWELVRLGQEAPPVDRSPAATLSFSADGRVGGTHVCNSLGSTIRWRPDGSFVRGPEGYAFVGTQIGCYGPGHEIGSRFWNMVGSAVRWRQDGERLFITGANGVTAELRFLI